MTDATTAEQTTAEAPAPKAAPKPKAKAAPAPKAKAAPAAPKSATPPTPKTGGKAKAAPAKASGPSIRERVFAALAKAAEGMTGKQVMEKLVLKGIPSLLKDEAICDKPRIKRVTKEGVRGVLYALTAAGRKDQEAGKVDDNAAEPSSGKDWPNGR